MSLRLIPESLAATPPLAVDRPAPQRPTTRPVEPSGQSGASNTGTQGQQTATTGFGEARVSTGTRPPGTDPSVPPQSLFDASLISASFKPVPNAADLEKKAEDVAKDEAENSDQNGDNESAGAADATSATPLPDPTGNTAGTTQNGSQTIEAGALAAYARGSGGSPLTATTSPDPEWMSAVERLA